MELMIVVAIVGILAAIAMPSYSKQLIRGRRADAQAFLLDIAQRQQQYILDARSYASTTGDLKLTAPTIVSKYYTITIAPGAGTVPTFTATATPIAGEAQSTDPVLTIDDKGAKTPATLW